MVEKQLPFESVIVDLGNKPPHFVEAYRTVHPDPFARAKVPILDVGPPGEPGSTRLVESGVVTRYVAARWPERGNRQLLPTDPSRAAKADLFADTFMSLVSGSVFSFLAARGAAAWRKETEKLARGLVACDRCLDLHGEQGGPFLLGADYSLAEALCAPFVIRALANFGHHRGVDPLRLCADLGCARMGAWLAAVRDRPSSAATSPTLASLRALPPYIRPRFEEGMMPASEIAGAVRNVRGGAGQRDGGPQGAMDEAQFQRLIREGKKANEEARKKKAAKM